MNAISKIDIDHIGSEWARLRHRILPALKFLRGSHSEADLLNGLRSGLYKMFAGSDSFTLAYVEHYKTQTRVDIFLGGGVLNECLEQIAKAEQWARDIGAIEIRTSVRPALGRIDDTHHRAPKGWKRAALVYIKDLTHG